MSDRASGSFVRGSFPTLRATEFDITLDGEQVVFSLRKRLDGEPDEVGRYALPPMALTFLKSQIVLADDT